MIVVVVKVLLEAILVGWKCRREWNFHWLQLLFQTTDAHVVTWMMMVVVSV